MFRRNGLLFRQVDRSYQRHYDHLIGSGLYTALVADGLLIPHEEVPELAPVPDRAYRVLQPEPVSFISYPYEWCPAQLRDAALATLAIEKRALAHGMSLRDANAFNIQFHRGRPVLIDTLSFGVLDAGAPWVGYRQFCQHFLAPLALAVHSDVRLSALSRIHIDGIPLDLASRLLPFRTRLNAGLLAHLHVHAQWQHRGADAKTAATPAAGRTISASARAGLVDSLESTTRALQWNPSGTTWGDYYQDTNYSPAAFEHKRAVVGGFLDALAPRNVWDLGANTGEFSRLASERGIPTLAFDSDAGAVEKSWRSATAARDAHLLPLLLDVTNPTPGVGWLDRERDSWLGRGPADVAMALALVHHLAIGNNVPLDMVASFFAAMSSRLIIEFVPREDSQVQRMLATREDIFGGYTHDCFEAAFGRAFMIDERVSVHDSARTLYRMTRRGTPGIA